MAFLPADIGRAIVRYAMPDNVEAQNVFTAAWNGTSTRDAVDAQADWEAYLNSIFTEVTQSMSDLSTIPGFTLYRVVVIGGVEQLEFQAFGTITPQPSNPLDMLPHGVAGLISSDLDGIGRGSSKKFFPGYAEGTIDAGTFVPAAITILQNAANAWNTAFGPGGDWKPGTWSQAKGFRSMINPLARSIPAYQRRRKPGVGI